MNSVDIVEKLLNQSRSNDKLPKQEIVKITKLAGDASTRKYYRIVGEHGLYVACLDEPQSLALVNFATIQKILADQKIPVPQIYDEQLDQGYLLEEDLGDHSFLCALAQANDQALELALYQRALELMIQIHSLDVSAYPQAPFNHYCFDQEKLMQEVELTLLHFIKGYLAHNLSVQDEGELKKAFSWCAQKIAQEKMVLTHRDYHSRNLMLKDDILHVIDFQDARLGLPQYDLVSLLEDSYFQLRPSHKAQLKRDYWEQFLKDKKLQTDFESFERLYYLMAIQRIFKAIGSFSYIYGSRKDARYLKYIGNSFENLRQIMEGVDEFAPALAILKKIYYGA